MAPETLARAQINLMRRLGRRLRQSSFPLEKRDEKIRAGTGPLPAPAYAGPCLAKRPPYGRAATYSCSLQSTDVGGPFLILRFGRSRRLCRKLQHCRFLALHHVRQENHLPIGKFQRIMMWARGSYLLTCRKMAVL